MPLDSWSGYFLKLSPTPLSFTVVRFWEPNTLVGRKEQFRGTHSACLQLSLLAQDVGALP